MWGYKTTNVLILRNNAADCSLCLHTVFFVQMKILVGHPILNTAPNCITSQVFWWHFLVRFNYTRLIFPVKVSGCCLRFILLLRRFYEELKEKSSLSLSSHFHSFSLYASPFHSFSLSIPFRFTSLSLSFFCCFSVITVCFRHHCLSLSLLSIFLSDVSIGHFHPCL